MLTHLQMGRNCWPIKRHLSAFLHFSSPRGFSCRLTKGLTPAWRDLRECSCLGSSCFLCWLLCCLGLLSAKGSPAKTVAALSLRDFQSDWKHFVLHTPSSETTMWVAFSCLTFSRFCLVMKKQSDKRAIQNSKCKIGQQEKGINLTLFSVHQASVLKAFQSFWNEKFLILFV